MCASLRTSSQVFRTHEVQLKHVSEKGGFTARIRLVWEGRQTKDEERDEPTGRVRGVKSTIVRSVVARAYAMLGQ